MPELDNPKEKRIYSK